ncbi:hypothetical protein SLA2020_481740 [Shorea laevis]
MSGVVDPLKHSHTKRSSLILICGPYWPTTVPQIQSSTTKDHSVSDYYRLMKPNKDHSVNDYDRLIKANNDHSVHDYDPLPLLT